MHGGINVFAFLGNAYRCSLPWDRLQREPRGSLDTKTVEEYRNFLGTLQDKGIDVMLVLQYFANPRWLAEKGGWTIEELADIFEDYAKKVVALFGDLVTLWNTINEPTVYVTSAYIAGIFPPYKKDPRLVIPVIRNLRHGHELAYDAVKNSRPEQQVGISNNTMYFEAINKYCEPLVRLADWFYLNYMLNQFTLVDYTGLSYYGRVSIMPLPVMEIFSPGKLDTIGHEHDKMYEIYPEGLGAILKHFNHKYPGKPIIITENGFFTDDDNKRIEWIKRHLTELHAYIKNGILVKGYFYWSTFNNWELSNGLNYPFGFVDVNPQTMERTIKESGKFYSEIAKNNYLDVN